MVGGDADRRRGYADAGDLLEELAGLAHPFHPCGHRRLSGGSPVHQRRPPARGAAPQAAVRQPPGHAAVLRRAVPGRRGCGSSARPASTCRGRRPAGVVERRKLAETSLENRRGSSLRYLRKHGRQIVTLTRARWYDRTPLAQAVAGYAGTRRSACTARTCSPSTRWSRRGTGSRQGLAATAAAGRCHRASRDRRIRCRARFHRLGGLGRSQRRHGAEHRAHQDQRHADGDVNVDGSLNSATPAARRPGFT